MMSREKLMLPEEMLIQIGNLNCHFNSLEKFLNMMIGKLSGFEQMEDVRPFILINHASMPQRIDIFESLCDALVSQFSHLSDYKETASRIRTAQSLRNEIIHNIISYDSNNKKYLLAVGSARGKVKATVRPIDVNYVKKAVFACQVASDSLYKTVLNVDPAVHRG